MKKENIILRKGDKVYYTNSCGENEHLVVFNCDGFTIKRFEQDGSKITKIERPESKYQTIYEAPKLMLDKEEKEYLEAVIRPFKDSVNFIEKKSLWDNHKKQFISMNLTDERLNFPNFDKGTMYKGMELNKEYTLKELGLFEGE